MKNTEAGRRAEQRPMNTKGKTSVSIYEQKEEDGYKNAMRGHYREKKMID